MPAIAERDKNTWIPVVEIADKGPELSTVGTQTAGIFYPSSTSLHQAEQRTSTKKTVYANTRDRLPQLQQHSPGNGEPVYCLYCMYCVHCVCCVLCAVYCVHCVCCGLCAVWTVCTVCTVYCV